MYKEENLTPAEKALEATLGQLKPAPDLLDRDLFMFNAGRASTGRKLPWQLLSGMMTVLLLCSILIRFILNEKESILNSTEQNNIQIVQTQYQPVEVDSPDSMAYPVLRENVIKYGLDALQFEDDTRRREPPMNRKEWLDSMLSS